MALHPLETKAASITSRLKLTDLQDPKKVRAIAERYLMVRAEQAAEEQANAVDDVSSIAAKISFKV